jgi:hypothetical protein
MSPFSWLTTGFKILLPGEFEDVGLTIDSFVEVVVATAGIYV